jgi:hypothetical protein
LLTMLLTATAEHCSSEVNLLTVLIGAGGLLPTLYQDVAIREQLKGFQRAAIGADEPLPPLDKLLLVPQQPADLYDVALHVILQDLQRLHPPMDQAVHHTSTQDSHVCRRLIAAAAQQSPCPAWGAA